MFSASMARYRFQPTDRPSLYLKLAPASRLANTVPTVDVGSSVASGYGTRKVTETLRSEQERIALQECMGRQ